MKLAALGEVMVELAPQPGERQTYTQSFAGDTYNTAVYAARSGVKTSYVTLLGDDPYSDRVVDLMRAENIDTSAIERLPGRSPGLYSIQNSADGERTFTYWRGESPARALFAEPGARRRLETYLSGMDCLYISGITLAIMTPEAREHLLTFIGKYRSEGGRVAFDSNYRPRLWAGREAAQAAVDALLHQADMALLTFEDEQALWGDAGEEACLARNGRYGLQELVLKRGAEPVLLQCADGEGGGELISVEVPPVADIVDTTGAGDSFNAGYLAARLQGEDPLAAAQAGNRCAARVIRHRGAIIPADAE